MKIVVLAVCFVLFAEHPARGDWPGANFGLSDWRTNELHWFIEWKRVRKYSRIAAQSYATEALPVLSRQAAELRSNLQQWRDGPMKTTCAPAADQLAEVLEISGKNSAGDVERLRALEEIGDRCVRAIQTTLYGTR